MRADAPLYERDPDAWRKLLAEGNATQPRKRVGADVLLRDDAGRFLLVEPSYKPGWDIPGGMAEANEAPPDTVRRELLEELGLDVTVGPLLCVDWVPPHDPWDDSLMFIFDGGVLSAQRCAALTLRDGELRDYLFCTEQQAATLLQPRTWRRFRAAIDGLRSGQTLYLQDGCQR